MAKEVMTNIIIAQNTETQPGSNPPQQVIINPLLVLRTEYMPTMLSFAVTCIVSGLGLEQRHVVGLKIIRVDSGEEIFSTNGEQEIPNVNPDNFVINANLSNINVRQSNGGEYQVKLSVDGTEFKKSFYILKTDE